MPIARSSAIFSQCKTPDIVVQHVNPYGHILSTRDAKALINEKTAQIFLDLCAEAKVPNWVIEIAPMDTIRLAA